MNAARRWIGNLVADTYGVTSLEYALLGSLIAVAIVTAVNAVSIQVQGLYALVAAAFP